MKRGEVWKDSRDPVKLGSGGTLWVFEKQSHGHYYFAGPALAEDGSHYHLMSYSVSESEIKNYEKHHDGFLNMPKDYQDKVRAEHLARRK